VGVGSGFRVSGLSVCVCVGSKYDIQGGGAGRLEGASKGAFRVLGCGCKVQPGGLWVSGFEV